MIKDNLHDGLLNADLEAVSTAAMSVIDRLQGYPAGVQLGALAYCFLSYARLTGQNVQDTFTAVNNMAVTAEGRRPEFAAVDGYLKKEVLKI